MDYRKYFQPQQKVLVRNLGSSELRRSEVFSAHLVFCSEDFFDLSLPYRLDEKRSDLFAPGTGFSIISSAMGMGVQVDAKLMKQLDATTLRLVPSGSLELFGQRRFLRAELKLRYGVLRRQNANYESLRRVWAASVDEVHAGVIPPQAAQLSPQQASLGAGGMGIVLPAPVSDGEVMLILLDLEDGGAPIWTLGEVVWSKWGEEVGMQNVGVRFNDITLDDQERIDRFVTERLSREGHDIEWYVSRSKLLEKLQF
jgi:hypothetical protein